MYYNFIYKYKYIYKFYTYMSMTTYALIAVIRQIIIYLLFIISLQYQEITYLHSIC